MLVKGIALSMSTWFVVHSNCVSLSVCVDLSDSLECTHAQTDSFVPQEAELYLTNCSVLSATTDTTHP